MRIKSDDSWDRVTRASSLNNCFDDQLMTEMQAVKNAECQNRRALNLSVISTVKETHKELMGIQSLREIAL